MKAVIISIVVGAVLIIGSSTITKSGRNTRQTIEATNVSIVNGEQIIEINARGGYRPRKSVAKAGIPTIIRFNTKGTFDCSASVRIPSLGISKPLPQTGSTNINIGDNQPGTLQGSCGMGMYSFEIEFRN